jgi:hypothetical protein
MERIFCAIEPAAAPCNAHDMQLELWLDRLIADITTI